MDGYNRIEELSAAAQRTVTGGGLSMAEAFGLMTGLAIGAGIASAEGVGIVVATGIGVAAGTAVAPILLAGAAVAGVAMILADS